MDKLIMQKDVESKLNRYKIMMSEVHGYYIDVTPSSPEADINFAKARSYYEAKRSKVVDREPVEVVEDEANEQ